MAFLVPFDGSSAAEAALARAVEHGTALGEDVVAVSFVPTGSAYAERNFAESGAQPPVNGITDRIQQVARDVGATVLFVGTDDTQDDDGLKTPFGAVTADGAYDVYLVRSR